MTINELLKCESSVKWVFAGDSITHGALHTYGSRDYVQIFEERIRYELGRCSDIVIKTGVSGWTTQSLLDNIDCNILQFQPQVVSIMIGMNDAASGPEHLDTFVNNYNAIIDKIEAMTGAQIFLHTPNQIVPECDMSREPTLPHIVNHIRTLGSERKLMVVDHWEEWTRAWEENSIRIHQWTADPIHPNKYGHKAFARLLFKELGIWDDSSICCGAL